MCNNQFKSNRELKTLGYLNIYHLYWIRTSPSCSTLETSGLLERTETWPSGRVAAKAGMRVNSEVILPIKNVRDPKQKKKIPINKLHPIYLQQKQHQL